MLETLRARRRDRQQKELDKAEAEAYRQRLMRMQAEALRTLAKQRLIDAYWTRNDRELSRRMERQDEEYRRKKEAQNARDAQRLQEEQASAQAESDRRKTEEHRRRAAEERSKDETRDAAWACAVLGVSPQASAEEIKKAYIAGMKQNHPDQVHTMSEKIQAFFSERAKRINMAYDLLKNHNG